MSKRIHYHCVINFETGESDLVEETQMERQKRLREEARCRRRAAFENTALIKQERITALTEAWRLAYSGRSFPIHYDLVLRSGSFTKTERYTLVDAAFSNLIGGAEGELVGCINASKVKGKRRAAILADVVHEARIG